MRSATEENYPYIETITMTRLDASGNPVSRPLKYTIGLASKVRPIPRRFPWFILGISIIQIMIYFFVDGAYMVRTFGYNPYRRDEFWRYLSVMFVHYNATHLWNSVRMQLAIGLPLEMVHGWKRVGLIYLMSVLGGTLFTPFVDFHTYSYGAKTAVLGLFFANVIDFTLNWRVMKQKHLRTFTVAIFMLHFSLLCLSGIHYPQIRRFRIHRIAHLGGGFVGLLCSSLLIKKIGKNGFRAKFRIFSSISLAALLFLQIVRIEQATILD